MKIYSVEVVNALGQTRTINVEASSRKAAIALVENGGQYQVVSCSLI
jgi:hypothetical protein